MELNTPGEKLRISGLVTQLEMARMLRNHQRRAAARQPPERRHQYDIAGLDEQIAALETQLAGIPRLLREQPIALKLFVRWGITRSGRRLMPLLGKALIRVARVVVWYARRRQMAP